MTKTTRRRVVFVAIVELILLEVLVQPLHIAAFAPSNYLQWNAVRSRSFHHGVGTCTTACPTFASGGKAVFRSNSKKSSLAGKSQNDNDNTSIDNKHKDKDDDSSVGVPLVEPFGVGVQRDFSSRFSFETYKSDILDGINAQSLAATLFLFFACLAPAVGFGGILGVATGGAMGAMEMLVSTSLCGVLYAILAPQPIQIIGPMGVTLAFTISLSRLASLWKLPFLPVYAWTGLWTAAMLGLASLTSASHVVQHLTPFTDEIFSVVSSGIFLHEAVSSIVKTFLVGVGDPTSAALAATTALLTLTCAMVTFGSALALRGLKTSRYFTKSIRNNLSNYAPAFGVLFGSLAARAARWKFGVETAALPILKLPTQFATTTGRPWRIPLWETSSLSSSSLPMWTRWACAIPASLAFVLLFLDQNITARLVNQPQYKMTKGRRHKHPQYRTLDGMHGDMLILSLLTVLASLFGLPWMAGATTRSAAHVRSLSVISNDKEGGGVGDEIEGTLENRVSGAAIHALIGACVLFQGPRTLVAQVPLPVLSGVFLYLGYTSLLGLNLWERIKGLFQEQEQQQQQPWYSIPRKTTTIFTLIQMACVGCMMRVTKSQWGVITPMMIALLPLLRAGLIKTGIISKQDMKVLD